MKCTNFCLFVYIALKGRNTKEQGKMCEIELFMVWKLISTQDTPPDTVGDRSEVTARDSQAATYKEQAESQHLAACNAQALSEV